MQSSVINTVPIKLIDAHHHLWNLETHNYPWLQDEINLDFFLGDYSSLRTGNYLPEDYLKDSVDHNVLATVHCEAEHDRLHQVLETRWVQAQYEHYGFPNAIVAHIWLHLPDCEEILMQHLQYSLMRGIRCKPVTSKTLDTRKSVKGVVGSMQDPNWLKGFALLEKYNLSWDLRVPFWHLEEAAQVARTFPNTRIVLNHTGFPWDRSSDGLAGWRQGMQDIAACPNVWVKISELGIKDQAWNIEENQKIISEVLQLFGIDRCMFASNFPVSKLKISYNNLIKVMKDALCSYSNIQQEQFFWRNAADFYRINLV